MTNTAPDKRTAPKRRTWTQPKVREFDTRAEITAYSGDHDLPWINR